jgi:hypothetical protein
MIQNSQADLITVLVGTAIKNFGIEALSVIAPGLDAASSGQVRMELVKYGSGTSGLVSSHKISFMRSSAMIDKVKENGLEYDDLKGMVTNNYYFKPNLTKTYLAELARERIEQAKGCDPVEEKLPRFLGVASNPFKMRITENVVGKVIFSIESVSLDSARVKICEQNDRIRNLISKPAETN